MNIPYCNIKTKLRISVLLVAIFPLTIFAQKIVRGSVFDSKNEPIFAANIYVKNATDIYTTTDQYGLFELAVPDKIINDSLVISYIGYERSIIPILSITSPLKVMIKEQSIILSSVVVSAMSTLSKEFSMSTLNKPSIYMCPSSGADPLKAIVLLPYSTNTSESAAPELRGSSGNLSRVFLNDVPINNPVRNQQLNGMGNFSIINTEIVDEMNVYPSNPPLEYGNTIAGLVDIKTVRQLNKKKELKISLSLANVGFHYSRSISNKTFFQLYQNNQYSSVYKFINSHNLPFLNNFNSSDIGADIHHNITSSSAVNIYSYAINESYDSEHTQGNYMDSSKANKKRNFNIVNFDYRNDNIAISLNNGTDFSTSKYRFGCIDDKHYECNIFSSLIVKRSLSDNISLKCGFSHEYSFHSFEGIYPHLFWQLSSGSAVDNIDKKIFNHNLELFSYGKFSFEKLNIGLGLRKNIPVANQENYFSGQINVRYNPNHNNSIILSLGNYNGYSLPEYILRDIMHISSKHLSLDYETKVCSKQLKFSVYSKDENTPIYLQESGKLHFIKTRIRGAELSTTIPYKSFKFFGSCAYLYSKFRMENSDDWYNSSNKLDYLIKLSLDYTNSKLLNASILFVHRPGLCYTPLLKGQNNSQYPLAGELNSLRYSDYSTVDLTINRYFVLSKNTALVAFASFTNILNRYNEQYAYYNIDYSERIFKPYQRRLLYFGVVFQL